jgi:dihydrofolate reductase
MRRLGFYMILTADGLYADPDGGLDHYDPAEDEHQFANALLRDTGAEVMGRPMYEVMAYWDELDVDDPATSSIEREYALLWRATPKHVVSRGDPPLRGGATLLRGDVVEAVRRLKEGDGPDIAIGCGSELFATLVAADLIDDFRFLVIPVALGQGKALFADLEAPLRLRLIDSRTFASGSVLLEYVRA